MVTQARSLDLAFRALSNPTRRSVFERLQRGPATAKVWASTGGWGTALE